MPTITVRKEVTKTELREMLYEQILKLGPEHFDQTSWFRYNGEPRGLNVAYSADIESCGTTACLAGHATALGAKINLNLNVENTNEIAREFGLSPQAFEYAPTQWPAYMRNAYLDSKRVNDNERDAEWWGALQYLISLRQQGD